MKTTRFQTRHEKAQKGEPKRVERRKCSHRGTERQFFRRKNDSFFVQSLFAHSCDGVV